MQQRYKQPTKNRRTLRPEKGIEKKSYNLKELHRTFCQENDQHYRIGQRASAAQLMMQNRQSAVNIYKGTDKKPKRQSSVNFYINIDKLKNLKISNRQKTKYDSMSAYLNNVNQSRKSMVMKERNQKNIHHSEHRKQIYRSAEQKSYQSVQRQPEKNKYRYKTNEEEKVETQQSMKGILMKRNNFKRTKNQQVKDKTFIDGYLKGKQLGRGGFSKVWEGFHFQSKIFYAVKEIDTQNKYQTHLTQIWFGNYFFQNGNPKKQFIDHPGISTLITMYDYSIVDPRAFIVYESCDGSLGNLLYDIYEEEGKEDVDEDDKLYMIKYKKLYGQLRKSTTFLKALIYEIAQSLDLLVSNKIIHSDLKTENILLKKNEQSNGFKFKLIDYGSSFMFQSLKQYKLATPQYMCPQLLNYILYENKKDHDPQLLSYMKDYKNISSIDVWSLGCIILQLIHGLPLWLTNPTKIYISGKYETKKGLFAVSDRSFSKILERQLYVVYNLQTFLEKNNNSGVMIDNKLKNILGGMLNPNPQLRLRPHQIITMLKS